MEQLSIIAKGSKRITDDYYKKQGFDKGQLPSDEDLSTIYKKVLNDEELRGFFSIIMDSIISSGWKLIGNSRDVSSANKKLKDLKFRRLHKTLLFNTLIYLHSFIECVPNTTKTGISKLKLLDTSKIEPVLNEVEDVIGWNQILYKDGIKGFKQLNNEDSTWTTNEIAHIEIEHTTPRFWGVSHIETLNDILRLKALVLEHLTWLFETNQFRTHFHAIGLGENDIEGFIKLIKKGMAERDKFLVTMGNSPMEGKKLSTEDSIPYFISLLNMLRNRMLTLLRVPPIIAGTVDNSNRSSSEVQSRYAYGTRLKSLMQDLEDEINEELFPRIGIPSRVEFKYNTVDLKTEEEIIGMAMKLIQSGADRKSMLSWLNKKGMELEEDIFDKYQKEHDEDREQMKENGKQQPMSDDHNGLKIDKNSTLHESRKPQEKYIGYFGEKNKQAEKK